MEIFWRQRIESNDRYIIRKILVRAFQKNKFCWSQVTKSKVMGIYVWFFCFATTSCQIWSCHVMPVTYFYKFVVVTRLPIKFEENLLNLVMLLLSEQKLWRPKNLVGGIRPPHPTPQCGMRFLSALGCKQLYVVSTLGSNFSCCTALGISLSVGPPTMVMQRS